MRILVCGAGNIGQAFIYYFSQGEHEIVIIDESKHILNRINKHFDVQTVLGDASSEKILSDLDLRDLDILIATTNNENVNLIICKLCSCLFPNSKRVVRLHNVDCIKETLLHKEMAIDLAFSPNKEITNFLYNTISGKVPLPDSMFELSAEKDWQGRGKLPLGIIRGENFIPYSKEQDPSDIFLAIGKKAPSSVEGRAIIVGGGNIGTSLAKKLLSIDCDVSIIEQNHDVARSIDVPGVEVIHGSPAAHEIMIEAGLTKDSTVVSTTGNDQINLISLLLAQNIGCKNTIGIINTHHSYVKIAKSVGVSYLTSTASIASASTFTSLMYPYARKLHSVHSVDIFLVEIISEEILTKAKSLNPTIIIREKKLLSPEKLDLALNDKLIIVTQGSDFGRVDIH